MKPKKVDDPLAGENLATDPTLREIVPELTPAGKALARAQGLDKISPEARGLDIFRVLRTRPPVVWPQEVAKLNDEQRESLIVYLVARGYPQQTISDKLRIPRLRIHDAWNRHCEVVGDCALGVTLPQLIGRVEARCDQLIEMAMSDKRPDRAWKIEKERVEMLQSLGIVDRAAKRYEIHHLHQPAGPVDEEASREIDRLIDLKEKAIESGERFKRIESKVLDPLPPSHEQDIA